MSQVERMLLRGKRVLLLSENESVPSDRRVWDIARALARAGCEVHVVCPCGAAGERAPSGESARFEVREAVYVHRYPLRFSQGGAIGYVREYLQAWRRCRRLVRSLSSGRPFDIVHVCNPPDFLLLAAWPARRAGARLIFDHHDLTPELVRERYGGGALPLYGLALASERLAIRAADAVIATNESYRRVATERCGKRAESVFVVRNGPDLARLHAVEPAVELKRGRAHLISYVGVMAPQDGVEHALHALSALARRRTDWHAVFAGEGADRRRLEALAESLGLAGAVSFCGWIDDAQIASLLCTSDLCLAPEPSSPLNDRSTMVKVAEYMAFARPIVAYDLPETRHTAGPSALYAEPSRPSSLADRIAELLDDPRRRAQMGACGRARVEELFAWEHCERSLLSAYAQMLSEPARSTGPPALTIGVLDRARQLGALHRAEGWSGVRARLRRRVARALCGPLGESPPLARADLVGVADPKPRLTLPRARREGDRLTIAWICVPQSAGAGGFTTIARLIAGLAQSGHRSTIYLYDRHCWPLRRHRERMRAWWPELAAEIRDLSEGIGDADAIFATSWETAYPLRRSNAASARMYLVQDLEPAFYAAGSSALLAEATYRFGFYGLTAGRWLAERLRERYRMAAEHFDLGADTATYRLDVAGDDPARRGVCLYVRPSTPRRAPELALAALELFAERHPEIPLHLYGERLRRLPFAARQHGLLGPSELNELYNHCTAGLALSATNLSLVPLEMLAAGCIPVINESECARSLLAAAPVRYAEPLPPELAAALCELCERPDAERAAGAAAATGSVQDASWRAAADAAEGAIRRAIESRRRLKPLSEALL